MIYQKETAISMKNKNLEIESDVNHQAGNALNDFGDHRGIVIKIKLPFQ